jgi:hypothetical protein
LLLPLLIRLKEIVSGGTHFRISHIRGVRVTVFNATFSNILVVIGTDCTNSCKFNYHTNDHDHDDPLAYNQLNLN